MKKARMTDGSDAFSVVVSGGSYNVLFFDSGDRLGSHGSAYYTRTESSMKYVVGILLFVVLAVLVYYRVYR